MLPAPGFHHLHLNSTDPEAALDFYTRRFPTTSRTSWCGIPALHSPTNVLILFTYLRARRATGNDANGIRHSFPIYAGRSSFSSAAVSSSLSVGSASTSCSAFSQSSSSRPSSHRVTDRFGKHAPVSAPGACAPLRLDWSLSFPLSTRVASGKWDGQSQEASIRHLHPEPIATATALKR